MTAQRERKDADEKAMRELGERLAQGDENGVVKILVRDLLDGFVGAPLNEIRRKGNS